jgi:hypothetical protein
VFTYVHGFMLVHTPTCGSSCRTFTTCPPADVVQSSVPPGLLFPEQHPQVHGVMVVRGWSVPEVSPTETRHRCRLLFRSPLRGLGRPKDRSYMSGL